MNLQSARLFFLPKAGTGVLVVNFPKKISPIHVPSFQGVGKACFIADGDRLRLYTPTQEFQNWVEILRNGHGYGYGLTERRLGVIYKYKARAMHGLPVNWDRQRLKLWRKEAAILESGKHGKVAERLPWKKIASMGKYGTPATKTMVKDALRREGRHTRSSKRTVD